MMKAFGLGLGLLWSVDTAIGALDIAHNIPNHKPPQASAQSVLRLHIQLTEPRAKPKDITLNASSTEDNHFFYGNLHITSLPKKGKMQLVFAKRYGTDQVVEEAMGQLEFAISPFVAAAEATFYDVRQQPALTVAVKGAALPEKTIARRG